MTCPAFLIPMAGMSSRFFEAGYEKPKYMLDAFGRSTFSWAVGSFAAYFGDHPFVFVALEDYDTPAFVRGECQKMGIDDARIVTLKEPTRGQAETVTAALEALDRPDQGIVIFNIDTALPGYQLPAFTSQCDGYLEVFRGSGSNWSYAKPDKPGSDRVVETAEKKPISDLCSTGLYFFKSAKRFQDAYEEQQTRDTAELQGGELYVAPLYNLLIRDGADIRCRIIDRHQVIFFGTPAEYEDILRRIPEALIIEESS